MQNARLSSTNYNLLMQDEILDLKNKTNCFDL